MILYNFTLYESYFDVGGFDWTLTIYIFKIDPTFENFKI